MGKKSDGSSSDESDSSKSSSSGSSSNSEKYRREMKKIKKKLKKEEKRREKRLKKKLKNEKKKLKKEKKKKRDEKKESVTPADKETVVAEKSSNIPIKLMEASKAMAPMTKEEWEKRQSVIRRVLDEESGRYRLIKGDGEVLEEIVSYKQHKEINRKATLADGDFFESQTVNKKPKK